MLGKKLSCLFSLLILSTFLLQAQVDPPKIQPVILPGFGEYPIEITASGQTRFDGMVAVAEDNVQVHYGNVSIYADYAEYNPESRDILLIGNARIYSPQGFFSGQRAVYNLETKQLRTLDFSGEFFPLRFRTLSVHAPSLRDIRATDALLTADDSSSPSFRIRSRTVRIYPNDRIVFLNSTLYWGEVPILWLPYLYSNLDELGFSFLPGYQSQWGAFLLTSYGFPLTESDELLGKVLLDYRTERGLALGFNARLQFGPNNRDQGTFESYYAWDQKPSLGPTDTRPSTITPNHDRYRVAWQQILYLTDEIFAKADINVLSDRYILEDFFPALNRTNPQPDTNIALTRLAQGYSLDLLTRFQVNDFQQTTERLPEFTWSVPRTQFFSLPVYYSAETSAGYLRRLFPEEQAKLGFQNFDTFRLDTLHQLTLPTRLFGWWNWAATAGFRITFYNKSGTFSDTPPHFAETPAGPVLTRPAFASFNEPITVQSSPLNLPTPKLDEKDAVLRPIFHFNVEQSFKLSRTFERLQARWLGLDGLRHILQPYTLASFVLNAGAPPEDILPFDRIVPSTQLLPLTFSQFTAIDSLDTWAIFRLGFRNTLQTRRSNSTFEWVNLDTFLDVNIENPYSNSHVSNLFNLLSFNPVPWLTLALRSQLPLVSEGFSELDWRVYYQPIRELSLGFGMAILEDNPFFQNSNQITLSAFWRANDHWSLSAYGQYDVTNDILLYQRYMLHRDLSSWIASIGGQIVNNLNGDTNYGLVFQLTLKDAPQIMLPFSFDVAGTAPLYPGSSNLK